MRKSKFANICLYISLVIILLNIFVVTLLAVKKPTNLVVVVSKMYRPIIILSIIAFISSIVSIVRITMSKKQLKGIVKSIISLILSVIMLVGGLAQGLLAEAALSVNKSVDGTNAEVEQKATGSNIPKFIKKDFDTVAVAKYLDENNPGYHKAGFIDKTGNFVIEPKFDDVKDFYEGLAPAKVDDKWGYIDKTGEFIIQPQFDEADIFSSGVAAIKISGKWGVIDKTGEFTIQPSFDKPTRFVEGLACLKSQDTGEAGYIDITGKFVIKPIYGYASLYFSEGYAFVSDDGNDFKSAGYVDKKGTFISVPVSGMKLGAYFSEGLLPVDKDGEENMGYIDKTGKLVIEAKFQGCDNFSEGLASAATPESKGKVGYIDKSGNIVIEPNYDMCYPFSEGLALVTGDLLSDNSYGYIDKTGKYIIEPRFDYATSFSGGLALVQEKDKGYGYIDKTGKYVIEPNTMLFDSGRFHNIDGVFDPKKAEISELEID